MIIYIKRIENKRVDILNRILEYIKEEIYLLYIILIKDKDLLVFN